jgi:hypothetical protein
MRWTKSFAMVAVLSGLSCFGQTPSNTEGTKLISPAPSFSIAVVPPDDIRLGSPINVIVTVTNVSGKEIYIQSDRGKDSAYKGFFYALTRDGREVETTFFHRKITGRQRPDDPPEVLHGSSIVLPHPPGKMFTFTIDLTRLYEITEPGLYTLDVSRFDDDSKTTVRSKSLTLKIAPQ